MFTNRISKIAIVTVVIVITLLMASFAASPKPGQSYPDYAQRHHSEISAGRSVDTTEYYQRHPELGVQDSAALAGSDYFMRHPELLSRPQVIDLTDYYFRHPEFWGN